MPSVWLGIFPSLHWESFCFNSDELQRGTLDRVPGFWLLCLTGFDFVLKLTTTTCVAGAKLCHVGLRFHCST